MINHNALKVNESVRFEGGKCPKGFYIVAYSNTCFDYVPVREQRCQFGRKADHVEPEEPCPVSISKLQERHLVSPPLFE